MKQSFLRNRKKGAWSWSCSLGMDSLLLHWKDFINVKALLKTRFLYLGHDLVYFKICWKELWLLFGVKQVLTINIVGISAQERAMLWGEVPCPLSQDIDFTIDSWIHCCSFFLKSYLLLFYEGCCFAWELVCVRVSDLGVTDGCELCVGLGFELGFSGRTISGLNCWAISPAHGYIIVSWEF